MVSFINFLKKNKNQEGITLIELLVVIFIVAFFSLMGISEFPKILRAYTLSRTTYKLSQDLRKVQDMGLSGVSLIKDSQDCVIPVKGYGVYVDASNEEYNKRYIIYADVSNIQGSADGKFTNVKYDYCEDMQYYDLGEPLCQTRFFDSNYDCVVEIINLDDQEENESLYISNIENSVSRTVSINFTPPNPNTTITTISDPEPNEVGIILRNQDDLQRSVWVNKSGLVEVRAQ